MKWKTIVVEDKHKVETNSNCLRRHSSSSSAASATINSEDGCACIVDFFLFLPPFPFRTDDAAFAFSSLCNVLKHPAHKSYSSPFGAHAPHANRALPGNIYKEHPSHVRGSSHTSARSMSPSALPMSSSMFALNLTTDGVLGRLMTSRFTSSSSSATGRCRTASVVSPGSLVRFAPTDAPDERFESFCIDVILLLVLRRRRRCHRRTPTECEDAHKTTLERVERVVSSRRRHLM